MVKFCVFSWEVILLDKFWFWGFFVEGEKFDFFVFIWVFWWNDKVFIIIFFFLDFFCIWFIVGVVRVLVRGVICGGGVIFLVKLILL